MKMVFDKVSELRERDRIERETDASGVTVARDMEISLLRVVGPMRSEFFLSANVNVVSAPAAKLQDVAQNMPF